MVVKWEKELGAEISFFQFGLTLPNKARALELGLKSAPGFMIFKGAGRLETLRGKNNAEMAKKILVANK